MTPKLVTLGLLGLLVYIVGLSYMVTRDTLAYEQQLNGAIEQAYLGRLWPMEQPMQAKTTVRRMPTLPTFINGPRTED